MRLFIAVIIIAVFIGCVPTQQIADISIPQSLVQDPLPALPESIQDAPSEIFIALYIKEDGSVEKVRFVKGSGSIAWDSLAINTIMRWQFIPAHMNDKPISTWFHLRAPLHYKNPELFTLAEIVCNDRETIDSTYKELQQGQDFGELAERYSVVSSREKKGEVGNVNIYCYPEYIRKHLSFLGLNEFTPPLKYGERFIIFKRIKK